MKKILALALTLIMLFSFAACGSDDKTDGNSSGVTVEKNTVDIVNNAYTNTQKALDGAKALGYYGNMVKSATVDGTTVSARMGYEMEYLDSDKGRVFGCNIIAKSGEYTDEKQLYDDTENLYGYKAGATYLLSDNEETDTVVEGLFQDIEFFDASKITVLSTKIVDTVGDGHGFVLEYDFNDEDFDAEEVIGTDMFSEKKAGLEVTVTGLRVSGIIDSKGRLTSQSVQFTYDYTVEVEVPVTDTESSQTASTDEDSSSETQTTEKVKKTVNNVITAEFNFDYDLVEVEVPDLITVMGSESEGEGEGEGDSEGGEDEPKKPEEISMTDFMKSSAVSTESDDE